MKPSVFIMVKLKHELSVTKNKRLILSNTLYQKICKFELRQFEVLFEKHSNVFCFERFKYL